MKLDYYLFGFHLERVDKRKTVREPWQRGNDRELLVSSVNVWISEREGDTNTGCVRDF